MNDHRRRTEFAPRVVKNALTPEAIEENRQQRIEEIAKGKDDEEERSPEN